MPVINQPARVSGTDTIPSWYLLAVFMGAFMLRALCLLELKDTHLLSALMGDGELYDIWAREILETGWLGRDVFFQAPFYPYFLAVVYRFIGENLLAVRMVQMIFGAGSCVLIALAGQYFLNRRAGMLSGFLLAVYPVAVFYDILIQKAVFGLFFTVLLLYLMGRTTSVPGRHKRKIWLSAGLTLGCLIMVRENALILIPAILLWLIIYHRHKGIKQSAVPAVLFILGIALVVLPVGLRNLMVGKEFTLTTSNLGYNLYVGNSIGATGTYRSLVRGRGDWRFERDDAIRLAEEATGKELSPAQVSQYWTGEALKAIGSDLPRWGWLMMKKFTLVWNAVESGDTESIYAYQDFSKVLKFPGYILHFGVLLPLAAAGIILSWPTRRRLSLLYMVLFGYAAGIVPFFVFARYRQTMLAVLVPFAAFALVQGQHLLRKKNWQPVAAAVTVALLTAIFANITVFPKDHITANTYYNWGSIFEHRDRPDEARKNYSQATRLNPGHALAWNNLGILACRQGEYRTGIRDFQTALKAEPGMAKTHGNLAIALYHTGDLEGAAAHFKNAIGLAPNASPGLRYNLACVLARLNRPEQALIHLKEAVGSGYANREQLASDPDLAPLRGTRDFADIMTDLKGRLKN